MGRARRTPPARPVVHAATGVFALLLGVLPPLGAVLCAVAGVIVGWVVFPWTGVTKRLGRPGEPFPGGLRTYPVAVLGLVVLLPPAEAAAAWAVLAFGDAAACVVGERVPSKAIFGHRKATWAGSAAHLGVGGLAAWGLGRAVAALAASTGAVAAGPPPTLAVAFAAAAAAVLADLVLPLPDDNLSGAAAAGGALVVARALL